MVDVGPQKWLSSLRRKRARAGFTYPGLLLAIALTSAALATTLQLYSATSLRQHRVQLNWAGEQYRRAIASYYEASPGGAKQYPANLEDLLLDRRYLAPRRHLRQLYNNPLTQRADWEPIHAAQGGIAGVRIVDAAVVRYWLYQPGTGRLVTSY